MHPCPLQVDSGCDKELVFGDPKAPRFVLWGGRLRPTPSGPDALTFDLMSFIGKIRAGLGAVGLYKNGPMPGAALLSLTIALHSVQRYTLSSNLRMHITAHYILLEVIHACTTDATPPHVMAWFMRSCTCVVPSSYVRAVPFIRHMHVPLDCRL